MAPEGSDADSHRGYLNADGTPRPFPLWYCLLIVVIATVFFPLLFTGWVDSPFFRRAHLQRWTVIFSVGLLQLMRAVLGWVISQVAWTWLAWILVPLLIWRIWTTANVWWMLIEKPAAFSANQGGGA
jgi:hypothetical protein